MMVACTLQNNKTSTIRVTHTQAGTLHMMYNRLYNPVQPPVSPRIHYNLQQTDILWLQLFALRVHHIGMHAHCCWPHLKRSTPFKISLLVRCVFVCMSTIYVYVCTVYEYNPSVQCVDRTRVHKVGAEQLSMHSSDCTSSYHEMVLYSNQGRLRRGW